MARMFYTLQKRDLSVATVSRDLKQSGDRIKNDRRDARGPAYAHRIGEQTAVDTSLDDFILGLSVRRKVGRINKEEARTQFWNFVVRRGFKH